MWKLCQAGFALSLIFLTATVSQGQTAPTNPTAELLLQLIRINTSNPPGNEEKVDEFLAAKLKPLGFQVEIIPTPAAGKSVFLARLKGNGTKKPILLAAHADVVGVERAGWSVDPFAGVVEGGYIYGRGAIDNKGSLAVFTEALMRLAKNKVPLDRDIILLSEADEESGPYNTEWLAEHYFPKIDCAAALNEGGWIIQNPDGKVRYVSISTADKISVWLQLTAHGVSTHSSMPVPNDAIFHLARALNRLADYDPKVQLIPSTRQFFLTLAKTSQPPMSTAFYNLVNGKNPEQVAAADKEISKNSLLHAIMRNTIAPVYLAAGFRGNVIPGMAAAKINLRLIPGTKIDDVIQEIQSVIHDPSVDVTLASGAAPGTKDDIPALRAHIEAESNVALSSTDTDLYKALAAQAQAEFHAPVTPYLFQAGTDADAWRGRGIPVYGIYPYPIPAADLSGMHGDNERVAIRSLAEGTDMIYKVLVEVAARPSHGTSGRD
ncbi:MAG TPA: M20/M25/M40 family metallo-hydrolase [Acidobacteriaceae bacterium]|jgi:acetylornithine deacetylase/succinyl-diaminopimelate desuccinylase-like protein|nr:M20/M25/M40 family metallo-hydrolase [Acidobacteriaceae bacterium]